MGKPLPNEQVLQIGLWLGIGGMFIFLLLHLIKRKRPDFLESIGVIIFTAGIWGGVEFGRVALFAKPDDLGIPAHYRVPMIIGAIAMVWRSVQGEIKLFSPIFTAKRDEPPQDSTQ